MADRVTNMAAVALVEDLAIYPRNQVNDYYVTQLAEAIRAGVDLPPLVADRASLRLTDGFQRRRAHLRVFGEGAMVDVRLRDYADEAAMFQDAALLNAGHGSRLAAFDQARCLILGEQFGILRETMAGVLGITKERAERLGQRQTADGVPLKYTMAHLAGQHATPAQLTANRQAGGKDQTIYIRQVIALLEAGALDLDNERVKALFDRLHVLVCATAVAA